MRQLVFAGLVAALVLTAQSTPKFESCGLGRGHHECGCVRRVQAIRQARIEACEKEALASGKDPRQADCFKDLADHCSLAESRQSEDGDDLTWDPEQQEFTGTSRMGPMCTMACRSHDCTCDDGPTCHFGHTLQDHESPKFKKR